MTAVDTEPLAWDPLNEKYKGDPHRIWKRLRDEAPLYYNEDLDFYAVSRFADVDAFSRDPKTFLSGHGTVMEMITADPVEMEIMIFMDPPEHTRYRRLVSKAFTPRRMMALEDEIRALCVRLLDELQGRSSFDYVQDFAAKVPAYVIAALLGVPHEDRDFVRGCIDESFHLDPEKGMSNDISTAAMFKLMDYVVQDARGPQEEPAGRHVHRPPRHGDHRGRRRGPPPHHGPGRQLRHPHRQRRHRDRRPPPRLGRPDTGQQPRAAGRAGQRTSASSPTPSRSSCATRRRHRCRAAGARPTSSCTARRSRPAPRS